MNGQILTETPERKRRLDELSLNCMLHQINLREGRDQWQALVISLLNFQVLSNSVNCLIS
jgi:hypothetical protein